MWCMYAVHGGQEVGMVYVVDTGGCWYGGAPGGKNSTPSLVIPMRALAVASAVWQLADDERPAGHVRGGGS